MTLRQLAIRIALLGVVFYVLLAVFRYMFETDSPYIGIVIVLLMPGLWIAAGWMSLWQFFE